MKKPAKVFLVVALIVALLLGYILYENNIVRHTLYSVESDRVPNAFDGMKIALITDFHNSSRYERVLDAVRDSSPDIICIVGDLISMDTTDYSNTKIFLKQLTNIAKVYYSYGNHEYFNATYRNTQEPEIDKILNGIDIIYMNNMVRTIEKDGEVINIVGYKDSIHGDNDGAFMQHSEPFLAEVSSKFDPNAFSILMIHRGQYFDEISKYPFDLVLSGHLHGGGINLPYIKNKILNNVFGNDKYSKGVYYENGRIMVLSGGCSSDSHIRLLNPPEVVTVVLNKK